MSAPGEINVGVSSVITIGEPRKTDREQALCHENETWGGHVSRVKDLSYVEFSIVQTKASLRDERDDRCSELHCELFSCLCS